MKNVIYLLILGGGLLSCSSEENTVQEAEGKDAFPVEKTASTELISPLEEKQKPDSTIYEDGLKIKWIKKGKGEKIKNGEVVNINYAVFLDNGLQVDGNEQLGKPFPFMVGFQMQTKGWDTAFRQLSVGDSVEIFLPSELARGEKGMPGLIPPNANNKIHIGVVEKMSPTRIIDGNKVWLLKENTREKKMFGDSCQNISFYYMASTENHSKYENTFASGELSSMKLNDTNVVVGLNKALINAKTSDRMYVWVKGVNSLKNSSVLKGKYVDKDRFYNIMVMDVR